jgi:capsular polysaccharide biosynthesis protein
MTPYQSDWMVTNSVTILTADHYLLADVSREYPGQLPNCTRSHSTYHRLIDRAHGAKPEAITGNIAVLAGLSGHNYFHWMVDVLPRLELLRQSGIQFAEIDRFWINEVRSPFQQATLDHLGIPAAKWLSADRHPAITADRLTVPSFPSHLGWAEAWVLNFLRQQFLPIASSHPCHERIYISRNQANHRRLLNEAAVIERLQSIGFVVVEPEHLSFSEQIALFSQAKVIVAPHGGGLTNLIFASPGTIVIEFMTRSYMRHYYWQISQQLQLQHFVAIGEPFTCPPIYALMYPSPLMEDIWLDLATLEKVLAQADLL